MKAQAWNSIDFFFKQKCFGLRVLQFQLRGAKNSQLEFEPFILQSIFTRFFVDGDYWAFLRDKCFSQMFSMVFSGLATQKRSTHLRIQISISFQQFYQEQYLPGSKGSYRGHSLEMNVF